jgi:hypothetical protein
VYDDGMLALAALVFALASPLPDLDQAPPFGVRVVAKQGRLLLVFGSAVDNRGPGPLIVSGRRVGHEMRTWQVVGTRRYALPVRLRYVREETHQHWHFPNFERYELRRLDGTLVGRDRKTGFCLRDSYETRPLNRTPVWTGQCRRNEPAAAGVREGISPGFGDDYVPQKEGQSIDVTHVPPGRYMLIHIANPDQILRERTYLNNSAAVMIRLRGRKVTVLRSYGTWLGRAA